MKFCFVVKEIMHPTYHMLWLYYGVIMTLNDIILSLVPIRYFCVSGTKLHHYVLDFMFIVLMTTAHEKPGGGQDGGCVDDVTQQSLSKYLIHKHNEYH